MLDCADAFNAFRSAGVRFFTGVPDSLLKSFCAYVADVSSPSEHVIAANEGAAVALAAGHFLATGSPAVVYMQNSGQGNAINPLLSLADKEVYGIPLVLLVGWRGHPDEHDEPQHRKQGRVMLPLFDAMEIPWTVLSASDAEAKTQIEDTVGDAIRTSSPRVLIVKSDLFATYKLRKAAPNEFSLSREEALRHLAGQLPHSCCIVSTTGKTSRELFEYRASQGIAAGCVFLTVGSMGHASQIALGIAMAQPRRRVVCLDGDGALIMHMGSFAILGQQQPKNLIHVVLNNGAHDSVGGQPTAGFNIDIPAIARACGYRMTCRAESRPEIERAIEQMLPLPGPTLLEIRVKRGARSDLGRPTSTPEDNKRQFMKRLASNAFAEPDTIASTCSTTSTLVNHLQ